MNIRIITLLCALALLASCQNSTQKASTTENTTAGATTSDDDNSNAEMKDEIETLKGELEKAKASTAEANEASVSKKQETAVAEKQADHYICYTNDAKKSMRIWISFAKDGKALQVKYEGQKNPMNLIFEKEDYKEGGAYPTTTTYYKEMYEGKVNGYYELVHAGAWDYAHYSRLKDGKVFHFTIDRDANPYGKTSCF